MSSSGSPVHGAGLPRLDITPEQFSSAAHGELMDALDALARLSAAEKEKA